MDLFIFSLNLPGRKKEFFFFSSVNLKILDKTLVVVKVFFYICIRNAINSFIIILEISFQFKFNFESFSKLRKKSGFQILIKKTYKNKFKNLYMI